ncbi:Integral membrane protein [Neofusicoccum parvum]|uniref:Integral membrane protein n=1 Tax=Neofusicoccum parvum TaxID=310453 RepID=A0ACB5RU71_9PEZI|nr:Integral membrane protein [Neofusicoccum parvum]
MSAITFESFLGPFAATLPPPNHDNPQTLVPALIGTQAALTVLVIVFVGTRFYTRLVVMRMFGWDDFIIGLAAATSIALMAVTSMATTKGTGYHLWDVEPAEISDGFRYTYWIVLLFYPITTLTKISVCIGYLGLFPGKKNRLFCYVMIGYSSMYGVALFFAHVFQCTPISVFWNEPFDPGNGCINKLALYTTAAALNSLGDLLVYLWPVRFLFKLQMPLKHRLGLIILFSLGCCVFAVSLLRITYLPSTLSSIDIFYNSARLHLVAAVEEAAGIICGCLPAAKALLKHSFPATFGRIDPAACASGSAASVASKRASRYEEYRRSVVVEAAAAAAAAAAGRWDVEKGDGDREEGVVGRDGDGVVKERGGGLKGGLVGRSASVAWSEGTKVEGEREGVVDEEGGGGGGGGGGVER